MERFLAVEWLVFIIFLKNVVVVISNEEMIGKQEKDMPEPS